MTVTTTIQLKQSAVANKTPQLSDLSLGELAVNTANGNIFYKTGTGGLKKISTSIVNGLSASVTKAELFSVSGGPTQMFFRRFAVDSKGNYILAGEYLSTSPGGYQAVVVKATPSGTIIWSRELGTSGASLPDAYYALAVDSNDNVYVGGEAYDASASYVAVLVKYNSAGTLQWQRTHRSGTTNWSIWASIAVDSSDNVICVGYSNTASNGSDGILAKFDSNGVIQWKKYFENANNAWPDMIQDIVVDKVNGFFYMVGYMAISATNMSNFIAKYDLSGNLLWLKRLNNSTTNNNYLGLTLDSNQQPIYAFSAVYTGNTGFLVKFDISGNILWQRQITVNDSTNFYPIRLVCDSADNVYCGGYVSGTLSYAFVIKYNSSGVLQRQVKYSGGNGFGLVIDAQGNFLINDTPQVINYVESQALPFTINGKTFSVSTFSDATGSATGPSVTPISATSSLTDAASSYAETASQPITATLF